MAVAREGKQLPGLILAVEAVAVVGLRSLRAIFKGEVAGRQVHQARQDKEILVVQAKLVPVTVKTLL
jgi:hypothetical protein